MVWQHTETHHWMIYYSPVGNPVPEVVWNEGEHIDENGDGACDICEYQMR